MFFGAPDRPVLTVADQLTAMDRDLMRYVADGSYARGKTRTERQANQALARQEFLRLLREDPVFYKEMVEQQKRLTTLPQECKGLPFKRKTHKEWIEEREYLQKVWGHQTEAERIPSVGKWDVNDSMVYEMHCPDNTAEHKKNMSVCQQFAQAVTDFLTTPWSAEQIRMLEAEREAGQ